MPQIVTYNDARILAQIDNTNPLSSYLKSAVLPNTGAGNALTEIVHNATHTNIDIATQGNITWNIDGSISYLSTPNGYNPTNTTGYLTAIDAPLSVTPFYDDMLLFVEISKNGNANSNNFPSFIKLNKSWSRSFYILKDGYSVNSVKIGTYGGATYTVSSLGSAFGRSQIVAHYKAATSTIDIYVNGVFEVTINSFLFTSSTVLNEYQIAGMDANCSFYCGYALAKTGSFTQSEIDSIVANPYQLFKVAGAVLTTITSDLELKNQILGSVFNTVELQNKILSALLSVFSDLELRNKIYTSVIADTELQQAIYGISLNDIDLQTSILSFVQQDNEFQTQIFTSVNSTVELQNAILSAILTVTSDLELRNKIYKAVVNDIDLRNQLLTSVNTDIDLRAQILKSINADIEFQIQIYAFATNDIEFINGIYSSVYNDVVFYNSVNGIITPALNSADFSFAIIVDQYSIATSQSDFTLSYSKTNFTL